MLKRLLKNKWFWIGCLPLFYLLGGFVLLPWLTQTQLPPLLKKQYNLNLSLGSVDFNPLTYELNLKEIVLQDDQQEALISIKHLYLDYTPSTLFHKEITIATFNIEAPFIDIDFDQDGTLNFSKLFSTNKTSQATKEDNTTQGTLPLVIEHFSLFNATGKFTDAQPKTPFHLDFGPVNYTASNLHFSKDDLSIHALNIALDNQEKIKFVSSMSFNPIKLHGKLEIEDISLPLLWAYLLPTLPAKLSEGALFAQIPFTLNFSDSTPRLSIEKADITFDKLTFLDTNEQKVITLPLLSLKEIDLKWPENTLAINALTLSKPFVSLTLGKEYVPNLLPLFTPPSTKVSKETSAEADSPAWAVSLERLNIDDASLELTDLNVRTPKMLFSELFFEAKALSLDANKTIAYSLKSRLDKTSTIGLEGSVNALQGLLDTTLLLHALPLSKAQPYLAPYTTLQIEEGTLSSQSTLKLLFSKTFDVKAKGDLVVENLALANASKKPLVAWKNLSLSDIDYDLGRSSLHVKKIELNEPYINLDIKKDGSTNFSNLAKEQKNSKKSTTNKEESVMEIRIGESFLKQGRAHFKDASLPIPFATAIHHLNGTITALDTKNTKPSVLTLDGKVDKYGYANIQGSLLVFDIKDSANLKILFKNIDMPSLTPYSGKFIGYAIDKGKLSMDLSYKIKQGLMEGDNKINLDSLTLGEPIQSDEAINLPLHLAIALLKDAKGQIDINLPVTGNLNDPDFKYGALVWKAFGNLIGGIIASPFNLIGSILGIETESLKSIDFLAGSSELIVSEEEKMDQYKKILEQKPQLKLRINPSFSEEIDTLGLQNTEVQKQLDAINKNAKQGEDSYSKAIQLLFVKYHSSEEYAKHFNEWETQKRERAILNEKLKLMIVQKIVIAPEALQTLAQKRADVILNTMNQKHKIPLSKLAKVDSVSSSAIREKWVGCTIELTN